jgi:hypothetical protein
MPEFNHIFLPGSTSSFPYSTHGGGGFNLRPGLNRGQHGQRIQGAFTEAVSEFSEGDSDYEFVYIEFESAINFELAFDRFEDTAGNIRLATCRAISSIDDNDNEQITFKIAVYLNRTAVSNFLAKIEEYIGEDTPAGRPRNQNLVANIENIRAATLESFWQEPEINFPQSNENVWWEVWFNKVDANEIRDSFSNLRENNLLVNERLLEFPENTVCLVKGTVNQLAEVILYQNNLAELRKPVETSDFFTNLDKTWTGEFIDDLKARIINQIDEHEVSVCLLDTGVNRVNPLLEDLIPARNLDSINPSWTNSDSYRFGHGTPMAGLILYGDLNGPLSSSDNINISNNVESIKIIDASTANDPDLYGKITLEAIASAEIINPSHKRIVCLAVTAPDHKYLGRPSSWSAAIDQKLFGTIDERNDNTLVLISGGNLPLNERLNYPLANDDFSIEDPAQSFNSITVGSFTNKDRIDIVEFPGATLLANHGAMAPCNSTSIPWNNKWPRKPDVVFEGGNDGVFETGILDHDSLKLLSSGVGGVGKSWLTTFSDTSASVALASKFASELYQQYPGYKPETIRALIIHSADWNDVMLNGASLSDLNAEQKTELLSKVGYGIPYLDKAKYSAENSLSIIAERSLKPFKYEDSRVKTNEFHLFDLPWPSDILVELAELEVKLKITLSYFVEPNPGNRRYEDDQSYKSHGLRFKMIDRAEGLTPFKARVSKAIRDGLDDYVKEGKENWILGSQVRDKGSIHKDIWIGSAADLALRNKIAIYPVGGWWKNRKKLGRYTSSVDYSLVISIETDDVDVDIYNNVLSQIEVPISISTS